MHETSNPYLKDAIPAQRLSRDLANASQYLSNKESRYLVDLFYITQKDRGRCENQLRAMGDEPHEVLQFFSVQTRTLENQLERALKKYASNNAVGIWAMSVYGIGPIISAGLLAHIDITKAPTVGHIWSYAGYDPKVVWNKGEKRPWNASLKVLCWKIGDMFRKFHNREECWYGKYYEERKAYRIKKNEAGGFAENAEAVLKRSPSHKQKAIYETGKLSDGHIDAMARRDTVKLFLSHWHDIAYRDHYGVAPPLPYPIAHLGHAHMIHPDVALKEMDDDAWRQ